MTRIRFGGCDLSPGRGTPGARGGYAWFDGCASPGGERRGGGEGRLGRGARGRGDRLPRHRARPCARPPGRDARAARTEARAARIDALFAHQASVGRRRRGQHLVVTTGTASGKTLAFNLPVLDALARDPKLRTLYLYPTKALAQDQARALAGFRLRESPRRDLRRRHAGRAALADPQLGEPDPDQPGHAPRGVLPHHDRWGDVLSNLRYVVVDEAHVYRGVFGSHVANVLRRLRRLARATAPSRSSCSRRRRSRTPPSSSRR